MNWTVVIPFGGDRDPARDRALRTVTTHLTHRHRWPIVTEYDPVERWSKGEVVDEAVARVQTEGIIVHDADVLCAPSWLAWSVLAVELGRPWSMPHATVHRLSRRATMRVHDTEPDLRVAPPAGDLERRPHPAPVGGGIVVLTRRAYDLSGGIDPRFVGWGGEDISWGRALDTIVGPCAQGAAPLWHLWHPPQRSRLRGGRGSRANEILASRYLDAVGDVVAMSRVVAR